MFIVRSAIAHVATCTTRASPVSVRDATSRTSIFLDPAWTRSKRSQQLVFDKAWMDRDADGRKMEHAIGPSTLQLHAKILLP